MINAVKVLENTDTYEKTQKLYEQAFPVNERGDLKQLLGDDTNHSEVMAFYDDEIFCGFVCLLTYLDITHILYFAIEEVFRGRGYGSKALNIIRELKPNNRIIADVEVENKHALNNEQRKKRKEFYLKNGYNVSKVSYPWRKELYEILVNGGELKAIEFGKFWHNIGKVNKNFSKF